MRAVYVSDEFGLLKWDYWDFEAIYWQPVPKPAKTLTSATCQAQIYDTVCVYSLCSQMVK
jgi:hypothetical protein